MDGVGRPELSFVPSNSLSFERLGNEVLSQPLTGPNVPSALYEKPPCRIREAVLTGFCTQSATGGKVVVVVVGGIVVVVGHTGHTGHAGGGGHRGGVSTGGIVVTVGGNT